MLTCDLESLGHYPAENSLLSLGTDIAKKTTEPADRSKSCHNCVSVVIRIQMCHSSGKTQEFISSMLTLAGGVIGKNGLLI